MSQSIHYPNDADEPDENTTGAADGEDSAYPKRVDALPPVPLVDEQLEPLAVHDDVVGVWVPDGRPQHVETLAGVHAGDILDFYLETSDVYAHYIYTSEDGLGLAWYRCAPIVEEDAVALAEEVLQDDYQRLEEVDR